MANTVEIIIKAIDQASGNIGKATSSLDKLKAGFKSLTGFSLSSASGIAAAYTAISKVIDYTKKAVSETVAYNSSIIDMSRVLGLSTEETSRLVQAADDLFISQEKLNIAMLAASRQGVDVSVNGLKKLSEEYLSLTPGLERAQFLLHTFGRSGADMGKLMEVGASGIDSAMAAISNSLVVTEAGAAVTKGYMQSVDNLKDSFDGIKYVVGQEVMPLLTDLNIILAHYAEKATDGAGGTKKFETALLMLNPILYENYKFFQWIGELLGNWADDISGTDPAMKAWADRLQGIADEYYRLHPELVDTTDAISEQAAMIAELDTKMATLYKTMTDETDWKRAWTDITEGPTQPAERAKKSFDLLGSKLTELGIKGADIWTGLLEATGQISPEAIKQFAIITAEFENIKRLTAAGIPVDVIVSITMNNLAGAGILPGGVSPGANIGSWILKGTKGGPGTPNAWWNETTGSWYYGDKPPGMAGGGPVWGSTPYIVGEKGPELFVPEQNGTIVPNGKLGGSNVTFYGDAYFAVDREITAQDIMKQMRVEA